MMGVLEEAVATVRAVDIPSIWRTCRPTIPRTYAMLQAADTVGVFQVESPRANGDAAADETACTSTTSPCRSRSSGRGPIVGKMVHPYLARRAGREPVVYPHAELEPVLARTLGVPLFQEQLMRVAMVAAGFTGGEAEELRRAMGSKRSVARMAALEARLRAGHDRAGLRRARAGRRRAGHHVVCALRLPRVARGELRADRVRERVPPRALPRDVLRGAAQPLAHGLLSPGYGGEGRPAPRGEDCAHRRDALGLGLHARGCAVGAAGAPGAQVRPRAARATGRGPCCSAGAGGVSVAR
jgi:hypothetical protein